MEAKDLNDVIHVVKHENDPAKIIDALDKYAAIKYKTLIAIEDLVADEMAKNDDDSDLCIIGEIVVSRLGYWE